MLVIRAIEPWKLYSVGFSGARSFTLADALLGIETVLIATASLLAFGFTLADALLGIETKNIPASSKQTTRFTLADALLGIETGHKTVDRASSDVSLWLMPF